MKKAKKYLMSTELIMMVIGLSFLLLSPYLLLLVDANVYTFGPEPIQNVFLAMFYLTMSTVIARVLTKVQMKYFTKQNNEDVSFFYKSGGENNPNNDIIDTPWEQKVSLRLYSLYFSACIFVLVFTL